MARPPRIDFPGARHHVMNRASRRENIFSDPEACALFLSLLADLPARFRIRILAYAIMPNHYHLLLECPEGNLSRAMKFLGAEFTQRLNRMKGWDGPVFRGRFKSRLVTTDAYLAHLFAYIHLNPVRAGLAASADEAPLTSHRALVGLEGRPAWLDGAGLEESFGTLTAYADYLAALESGSVEPAEEWGSLWSRTAPVEPVRQRRPFDVSPCLAAISGVTGVPLDHVLAPEQPTAVRSLAAWALTQRIPNVDAARLLGCTAGRVSQLRAAAVRAGGTVARWMAEMAIPYQPILVVREQPAIPYRSGGRERWALTNSPDRRIWKPHTERAVLRDAGQAPPLR